jgi:hypothetical protein
MLEQVFAHLDTWLIGEASATRAQGLKPLRACEFKIVGQTALLEASLNLSIAATADVDAITDAEYVVTAKLNELLRAEGLELDPLSKEVWMPVETRYIEFYSGRMVTAWRADPVHVLLSKALKAPEKNRRLLGEYIAGEPSDEFFALCKRYKVDLKRILDV